VALLRGINVGGRNVIAMADLRAAFAASGFTSVSTYIQSGNVLFRTPEAGGGTGHDAAGLEARIEQMLADMLGTPIMVVVLSQDRLRGVVGSAPDGFGADPGRFHSDTVFLKPPLVAEQAMAFVELRDGVDRVWAGDGVLYFQRLSARRTQSKLSRLLGKSVYRQMTIRNWATTTRLLSLLDTAG
jgi:uncharacterized protein (DUF1697 family)